MTSGARRALLTGWFSFEGMGATSGDLTARDMAATWLHASGFEVDVANAKPFSGGVDWRHADPASYSHVVFVCGPLGNGWPFTDLLERFHGCEFIGLNLSMLQPLEEWNPFSLLLERDSSRASNPDITFASIAPPVPVVAVVLVHAQTEYPGALHRLADDAIHRLLRAADVAQVGVDTRLDIGGNPLRSPAAIEAVIRRTDAVVTTRLHGLVTALKLGIPALAIDPIEGGAKIRRQAETIGWPTVFNVDELDDRALATALDFCLSSDARSLAASCAARARACVAELRDEFVAGLSIEPKD